MEDMERYGDYDETEDEERGRPHPIGTVLKVLVGAVILLVIGILSYRLFLFEYYPKEMKRLYYTDALTALYDSTGGDFEALTQELRFPYDDNELGSFFCDHLIVIPGAEELQVAVRLNVSAIDTIEERYGLSGLDRENTEYLSFKLRDNRGRVYEAPVYAATDSLAMYRYYKLVFDDIVFTEGEDGLGAPEWIRLEVFVSGAAGDEPFSYVLIYEDNEAFSEFKEYKRSKEEVPLR